MASVFAIVAQHRFARTFLSIVLLWISWAAGRDGYEIRTLSIAGNSRFSDKELKDQIVTSATGFFQRHYFNSGVFEQDLETLVRFYRDQGYLDAGVVDTLIKADTSRQAVTITIAVKEGGLTRIAGVRFESNAVLPDSLLRLKVKLARGDPLGQQAIRLGGLAILGAYGDSGYLEAEVESDLERDSALSRATVVYRIREHELFWVGPINIRGLKKTRPEAVMRELRFWTGERLVLRDLLESQRNLYRTGLFPSVSITPAETANAAGLRDIVIEVKERKYIDINAIAGYGAVEKLRGGLRFVHANVGGLGRRIQANAEASEISYGGDASYTQPWTLGSPVQTELSLYQSFLDDPAFDVNRRGGRIQFARAFGFRSRGSAGIRLEDAFVGNVENDTDVVDRSVRIRSLLATLSRDTRDNFLNATRGTFLNLDQEAAGPFRIGSHSYYKLQTTAKGFLPRDRTVLAGQVQTGWIFPWANGAAPLSERFLTGGPNSIRGFGFRSLAAVDSLGGDLLVVANLEIRRILRKFLSAAAFLDAGNVWREPQDFRFSEIRCAIGAGPRFETPIGLLRFDIGFNPWPKADEKTALFYFGIGQAF